MKSSELLPNMKSLDTETIRRFWDSMNSDHRLKRHEEWIRRKLESLELHFRVLAWLLSLHSFLSLGVVFFVGQELLRGFGIFMDFQLKQME